MARTRVKKHERSLTRSIKWSDIKNKLIRDDTVTGVDSKIGYFDDSDNSIVNHFARKYKKYYVYTDYDRNRNVYFASNTIKIVDDLGELEIE
jgi:hypothetical protein